MKLRPFQREFVAGVLKPGTTRAALSIPRGNGKSWLAGYLAAESLTPGGALWESGAENILLSGSLDQARYVWRFCRELLGEDGYSYQDSTNKIESGTRQPTRASRCGVRGRRARLGSWALGLRLPTSLGLGHVVGGGTMADALDTAIGKPNTDLRVVYIGTLAPSRSGWWHDLIQDGSGGSTYIQAIRGDLAKWDSWPEIRRCNPLVEISAQFRKTLLEERDQSPPRSTVESAVLFVSSKRTFTR